MNYLVARVSDPEQRKALPAQGKRLKDYTERLRWVENKDFTYIEFDETAFKEDRKDFRKLVIERLEAENQLAIVVFDKIDRFSRDSSSDEKAALTKMWKAGKIEMHFPSDNLYINRDSPAPDLFRLDIGIALAGYYSSAIRDNVKRRFEQMLNDGFWVGKAHIGYKNIDVFNEHKKLIKKDIVVDEERAPLIVEAFELRSTGLPYRVIAKIMTRKGLLSNTKNPRPVVKAQWETIFTDPFYIGTMRYNGKFYKHNYKPIIEKWLWDKVQLVNEGRSRNATKYNSKPFLFKQLKCSVCGYAITFDGPKKNGVVYAKCTQYGGKHDTEVVNEADLINQFRELLKAVELPKDKLPKLVKEIELGHKTEQEQYLNAKKRLKKEYDELDENLEALFYERGKMKSHHDMFERLVKKIDDRQKEILDELESYSDGDKAFVIGASYLLDVCSRALQLFDAESTTIDQKRYLVSFLLSNETLDGKTLHFTLKEPFDAIINMNKSSSWLRRLDSNQQPRS